MGKMIKLRLTRQFRNKHQNVIRSSKPEVDNSNHPADTPTVGKSRRAKPRLPVFIWIARARRKMRHWYRNWVALVMYLASHSLYKVEIHGKENFSYEPSTIIACAHKRDIDIPVVIPCLYFLQRPSRLKPLRGLYFPARDDLYERGFLMIYFPWLDWFRFLIRRISVARNFWAVQACPVKLPDEQTVNQLLNETIRLEGDVLLDEAVTSEWRSKLMGQTPPDNQLHLSDAVKLAPLSALGQYATPRMFTEPLASRIRERHHRTIMSQLRHLTRILDKGGSLFIAPEGRVTPDGRFGKMRAAFTRIVQQSHANVRMLPVNLTYDFMDTQKPKVIVNVGQEVTRLNHYNKAELAELVKQKVASLATVTMSGIASRCLIEAVEEGRDCLPLHQLRDETWQELAYLKKTGVPVDSRLQNRHSFEQRLERFVEYGYGKGQLFVNDLTPKPAESNAADSASDFNPVQERILYLNVSSLMRSECSKPDDNPARYSYNELKSLLEAWNLLEAVTQPLPLVFNKLEADQRTAV